MSINFKIEKYKNLETYEREEFISDFYADLVEHLGHIPSMEDLKDVGLTREIIRQNFGSITNLRDEVIEENPELFARFFIPTDFNELAAANLRKKIVEHKKKSGKFLITTVQVGSITRTDVVKTIKQFEKLGYMTLLLPLGEDMESLDPILKENKFNVVTEDINLNSNIKISPTQIGNHRAAKPTSSLTRIEECTVIYPSVKLTAEPVPTDVNKLPRFIYTPGAITNPIINGTWKRVNRKVRPRLMIKSEKLANSDHEISAILVHVADDRWFFTRELMFDVDGSAIELTPFGAIRVCPNGQKIPERPLNFNLGDWHAGETSSVAKKTWIEMIKIFKPETITLHDAFTHVGHSHHTLGKMVVAAKIEEEGYGDPRDEFATLAVDLRDLETASKYSKKDRAKIYIVKSNHDEHIEKAVSAGILHRDTTLRFYCEIFLQLLDGTDPIKFGVEKYGGFKSDNVIFLGRADRHIYENKFGKLSLHFHFDQGNRGTKNSTGTGGLAVSIGCATGGHTHEKRILPGNSNAGYSNGSVWYNGTSTCVYGPGVPAYTRNGSPGAWTQTSTFLFGSKNGRFLRTQVSIVGGTWSPEFKKPRETEDPCLGLHTRYKEKRK